MDFLNLNLDIQTLFLMGAALVVFVAFVKTISWMRRKTSGSNKEGLYHFETEASHILDTQRTIKVLRYGHRRVMLCLSQGRETVLDHWEEMVQEEDSDLSLDPPSKKTKSGKKASSLDEDLSKAPLIRQNLSAKKERKAPQL